MKMANADEDYDNDIDSEILDAWISYTNCDGFIAKYIVTPDSLSQGLHLHEQTWLHALLQGLSQDCLTNMVSQHGFG